MNLHDILQSDSEFDGQLFPVPVSAESRILLKMQEVDFCSAELDTIVLFATHYVKECCAILNLSSNIAHMAQRLLIGYIAE